MGGPGGPGGGEKTDFFLKFWPQNLKIRSRDYQNRIQRPRFTPVGFPTKGFFKIAAFFFLILNFGESVDPRNRRKIIEFGA